MTPRHLRVITIALLTAALLVAGCGSDEEGGDDAAGTTGEAAVESGGSTDTDAVTDDSAAPAEAEAGTVDCAAIEAALDTVGFGVQILAQLRTQDQYNLVNDGTVVFNPDDFDTALTALAPLAAVETPLGSVAEGLDTYTQANALARENLAVDDPFSQASGDELAALTEDTTAFLGHQGPINFAVTEVGC